MSIFAAWSKGQQLLTASEPNWFSPVLAGTGSAVLIIDPYTTQYNSGVSPWNVTLTVSAYSDGQVISSGVAIASYTTGYNFHVASVALANGDTAIFYDKANAGNPSTGVDILVQFVNASGVAVGGATTLESNLVNVNDFRVGSGAAGGNSYDLTWASTVSGTETVDSQVFNQSNQATTGISAIDSFSTQGGTGEAYGFSSLETSAGASPSYIYLKGSKLGLAGNKIGVKYELVGANGTATTGLATIEPNYPTGAMSDTLVNWTFTSLDRVNGGTGEMAIAMRYSYVLNAVTSAAIDVRTLNAATGVVSNDVVIQIPTTETGLTMLGLANGDFIVGYGSATGPTLQAFSAAGAKIGPAFALPSNEHSFNLAELKDNRILVEYPAATSGGNQLDYEVFSTNDLTAPADFNRDARSDILWRDNSSGATEVWFPNGSGYGYAGYGAPTLDWQIAGTGDFNGDGRADILWRNATSGDAFLYASNDSGGFSYTDLGAVSTDWKIAGVADFTGDGRADILWRNTTTGEDEIWATQPGGGFNYYGLATVSPDWQIAATGDLNGDGSADLLWRNASTGDTEAWFTNASGGIASYANVGAASTDWHVSGIGDFNGDGVGDIVWRNASSGDAYLYASNGSGGYSYNDLGVVSTGWQIAKIGDFNGDGAADLLWRNASTGEDEFWLTKSGGGFNYASAGAVATNWTVAA